MKLVSIETIPGQEFEALDIVQGHGGVQQKLRPGFYGRYEDPGGR